MSKEQYYEAHITMEGDVRRVRSILSEPRPGLLGWKFSAIEGDANLGPGTKCYLTRQMNTKIGEHAALQRLLDTATYVALLDINVVRRKIELVLWDDRISNVPCVAEECATCPSNGHE